MQRYFCQLTCLYVFNIESLNIKSKDKLQITLFLTDACSQPITDIGQAKQDNNQKQTRIMMIHQAFVINALSDNDNRLPQEICSQFI